VIKYQAPPGILQREPGNEARLSKEVHTISVDPVHFCVIPTGVTSTSAQPDQQLPSTYSYDSASGFYYDSATGLHYDPKTQVLHSQDNQNVTKSNYIIIACLTIMSWHYF